MLVSNTFPKVFPITPNAYIGLLGLATDVEPSGHSSQRRNIYTMKENRQIKSYTLAKLVSSSLYE